MILVHNKNNKGFSLIELLITLSIISFTMMGMSLLILKIIQNNKHTLWYFQAQTELNNLIVALQLNQNFKDNYQWILELERQIQDKMGNTKCLITLKEDHYIIQLMGPQRKQIEAEVKVFP
ncbi:MAG: hypothetical protein JWM09_440 [Francisellaceae bacterium]|nr:hypothetical protein [Francisellaceae bacterium]